VKVSYKMAKEDFSWLGSGMIEAESLGALSVGKAKTK